MNRTKPKRKYVRRADAEKLATEREHLRCLEALLTVVGALSPLSPLQRTQVLEVVSRGQQLTA